MVLSAIFVCNCAYGAVSVDGMADYEQEQEMELEALQSILMDDIKGFSLLPFPNFLASLISLAQPCFSSPNLTTVFCGICCRDRPQRERDRHHRPLLRDPDFPSGTCSPPDESIRCVYIINALY